MEILVDLRALEIYLNILHIFILLIILNIKCIYEQSLGLIKNGST